MRATIEKIAEIVLFGAVMYGFAFAIGLT